MLNFAEQTGSGAVIVVWSFLSTSNIYAVYNTYTHNTHTIHTNTHTYTHKHVHSISNILCPTPTPTYLISYLFTSYYLSSFLFATYNQTTHIIHFYFVSLSCCHVVMLSYCHITNVLYRTFRLNLSFLHFHFISLQFNSSNHNKNSTSSFIEYYNSNYIFHAEIAKFILYPYVYIYI